MLCGAAEISSSGLYGGLVWLILICGKKGNTTYKVELPFFAFLGLKERVQDSEAMLRYAVSILYRSKRLLYRCSTKLSLLALASNVDCNVKSNVFLESVSSSADMYRVNPS